MRSIVPVFIGGCDRSGTTLLASMLGAHEECLAVPENQFKIEVFRSCQSAIGNIDLENILNRIRRHWRLRIWSLDIESVSVSQEEIGTSCAELIEWLVKKYGEKVGKPAPRIWVDHTPSNIRYASTLLEHFPDAKMIHLVRDGRAVAASIMPLDWGPNTIHRAAHWWVQKVAYGLAAESFWGENKIIRFRFEDLVRKTETSLRRLCSFLDIEYQPEMTKANGFTVPLYTYQQHVMVGKKPNAKRTNAWEAELTPREIEIFESEVGDLLYYLGYTPVFGLKARGVTRIEKLAFGIMELYKHYFINKLRYRLRVHKTFFHPGSA